MAPAMSGNNVVSQSKILRGPRPSSLQKEFLVEYMITNKDFAKGNFRGPLGHQGYKKQWDELMTQLNKIGPQKSVIQWKAVWKKKRSETRSANALRHRLSLQNGNRNLPLPLNETSQKVLAVIGPTSSTGIKIKEEVNTGEPCSVGENPTSLSWQCPTLEVTYSPDLPQPTPPNPNTPETPTPNSKEFKKSDSPKRRLEGNTSPSRIDAHILPCLDPHSATLKDISQSMADIAVSLRGIKELLEVFVKMQSSSRDKET